MGPVLITSCGTINAVRYFHILITFGSAIRRKRLRLLIQGVGLFADNANQYRKAPTRLGSMLQMGEIRSPGLSS
ncbi:hypothetical protein NPIL_266241 [Nephila pilipes]|uniref:Uncharacterized protein n=1 Tax=Nephila pilipes TaxID=299642 RepID=A0A8X6TMG8_NEPPI|nr:hypothetical protein NPIL_266241 [Nephila pilipes]